MHHSSSEYIHRHLIQHLVELEENRSCILKTFYSEETEEKNKAKQLIDRYIKELEALIQRNHQHNIDLSSAFPFVIIDCRLDLYDCQKNTLQTVRIISPFADEVGRGDISFLSHLGRNILLKKEGDLVRILNEAGEVEFFEIKNLRYPA